MGPATSGALACGGVSPEEVLTQVKIIDIEIDGESPDIALIDAVVTRDQFIGSRALLNADVIERIFLKVKKNFIDSGYQLIFIPSMRTPQKIINKANEYFDDNQIIIKEVDKKAYLSALKLADHIIVTCDSTSMISEAAMTGKPIYVAQMPNIKKNQRFKKFFELFRSLDITRDLENSVENWNYKKLNETDRISSYIKEKLKKKYDFS